MSKPNIFPGHTAVQILPAGFFIRRQLSLSLANFNRVQPRIPNDGWFDSCPQLSPQQKLDAVARGELKRLEVRLVSGLGITISEEQTPQGRVNSADANNRVIVTNWSNQQGVTSWFWATDGAVVVEVELYFDIPPADAV